jgi:hypothetical protein
MGYTRIAETSHERFMQPAQRELAKFERKENDFRKRDRRERAAELQISLSEQLPSNVGHTH